MSQVDPILTNFDEVSEYISPIISAIGGRSKRPFLVEDVRRLCNEGRAFLFMHESSFTVLRPVSKSTIQIWIAYGIKDGSTDLYLPVIKSLCKELDVEVIEFETALPGMERMMPKFGWKKAYTVWRQPVDV